MMLAEWAREELRMPMSFLFNRARRPTAVRSVRMTDFDQATSFFPSWQGQFEQISAGPFEAALRVAQGELVRVVQIEANQRISLRGRDTAGLCSIFPVIPGNAESLWHGRRLNPGQLMVHGADAETNHYSAKRSEDLGLSLRPEELCEAIRLLHNTDSPRLPETWSVLTPLPNQFGELNRAILHLLDLGLHDPTILGSSEGRMLEQECIRHFVASLEPISHVQHQTTLRGRAATVDRAEEFMRSRLADPCGAIDLCRELGVSDRTLRLAFRERYGVGPMVFYRCLRLNAVRTSLKAAPTQPVAEVAREFGFHHLGHFAADYRRLFGNRPSASRN